MNDIGPTSTVSTVTAPQTDTIDAMIRYHGGDDSACRELYQLIAPRLRGYLQRLCGDTALAEDLLQQTFMKLHHARTSYDVGADPLPWIFTIARRTLTDEVRRQRRSPVQLSREGKELPEIGVDPSEPGSAAHRDEEVRAAIAAALQMLPESQRRAVIMTKLEGRTMSEAARLLGTTECALKLRAHRAYATLRTELGPLCT